MISFLQRVHFKFSRKQLFEVLNFTQEHLKIEPFLLAACLSFSLHYLLSHQELLVIPALHLLFQLVDLISKLLIVRVLRQNCRQITDLKWIWTNALISLSPKLLALRNALPVVVVYVAGIIPTIRNTQIFCLIFLMDLIHNIWLSLTGIYSHTKNNAPTALSTSTPSFK